MRITTAAAADTAGAESGTTTARPFGIETRVPWTTSRVKGSPDPPDPYRTTLAFPGLRFAEPLAMTVAPGTGRLFVVERYGKVYSFANDPQTEEAELFFDLEKVIYGLAFHPDFEKNGYFYVTYVLDPAQVMPLGTRVSRFQVEQDNPLRGTVGSEKILLEWASGGHNGGCLKFGPDGCLYVATGDASDIADTNQYAQDLSNLPGSILRIDVDHPDPGKNYGIPTDNPFVDLAGAQPEIWAFGLRQPWKMSFDRATGDFWTGNVGQDLWEQIYLIERGGNYGWSLVEGSHPFRPERAKGPGSIVSPIIEHNHADFRSITGGFVYRGSRLEELAGAYIYGDYDTGRIWSLRYDGGKVTENRQLVDSSLRLVGFSEDSTGELYLVDHMGGGIHQLVPNETTAATSAFPRKLSDTGLFASVAGHRPAPGLIPYSVNAPEWVDGAHKTRYLAMPADGRIDFEAITYPQPSPGAPHGWKFPDGTVLVETISLELEKGDPSSRRRLETRILHHERLTGGESVGDQYWQGYTYLWNDGQDEATLLEDPRGLDRSFTINDPALPEGKRIQTWHFPSRAECTVCHNMAAKYVLGINTPQINKKHDYSGVVDNQLRTFEHLRLFTEPLPASPDALPRLADYADLSQETGQRARSYLHANCSHCHRKWGGGNSDIQLLYELNLTDMKTAGARPTHGAFSISQAAIIAPSAPDRSVLYYRLAKLGPGRMPRIGSTVVDEFALKLIHDWIAQIPASRGDEAKPAANEVLAALNRLRTRSNSSFEAQSRDISRLLASTSGAMRLMRAVDDKLLTSSVRNEVIAQASQATTSAVRDLFERFLPEAQRTKRLGSVIRPETILALPGDVARGKSIFFDVAGVQCRSCHQIGGKGTEIGPALNQIGKKYDRSKLLENMLEPSKEIDPKYLVYTIETKAGRIHTGLLVQKSNDEIVLKDAKNSVIRVPANDVELMVPQRQSMMPDLLLRDMTARDVADLLAYLGSLK
jgi:putative heme-binding domain-containing protein